MKNKFKLNRKEINYENLKFNYEIGCLERKIKLPLLVDEENFVLLGNSMRLFLGEKVECIVVKKDDYAFDTLVEFEQELVDNLDAERTNLIEKEINAYLKEFERGFEVISLFDSSELKETRLVSEENFIKPPPYNFDKHGRGVEEDEEDSEIGFFCPDYQEKNLKG